VGDNYAHQICLPLQCNPVYSSVGILFQVLKIINLDNSWFQSCTYFSGN
jgi:hypothetical protein